MKEGLHENLRGHYDTISNVMYCITIMISRTAKICFSLSIVPVPASLEYDISFNIFVGQVGNHCPWKLVNYTLEIIPAEMILSMPRKWQTVVLPSLCKLPFIITATVTGCVHTATLLQHAKKRLVMQF